MDKQEIEIVPGDGNINISPAQDHIGELISDNKKPKKEEIVIPQPKKKEEDEED